MNENSNIKRQIAKVEHERAKNRNREDMSTTASRSAQNNNEVGDAMQLRQMNTQLQKRVEFLQKREKDLLEHLLKVQKDKGSI